MAFSHAQLRKQFPFLTPPFAGDNGGVANEQRPTAPKIRVAFSNKGLTGVEDPKKSAPPILPSAIPPTAEPAPEPNPYEGYTPEKRPTPPINVRIGANTAGLDPIDRSVAVLDAQRKATSEFPSSKVTESGEILPPKRHGGFKDRFESAGKGALLGLERGGVGGALIGAITGGVSPVTIDKIQAERALRRKEEEVGRQIDIATGQERLKDLRRPPAPPRPIFETRTDEDGNEIRQKWNPVTGQMEDDIGVDGKPVIVGRPATRSRGSMTQQDEQGNDYYVDPDTGEPLVDKHGNIRYKSRAGKEKTEGLTPFQIHEYKRREAERQGKLTAAEQEIIRLTNEEEDARQKKDAAYAEVARLKQTDPKSENPATGDAIKAAQEAQAYYASFANKKREAQSKVEQYRVPEPAPQSAAPSAPSYSGRTMSKANLARYAKDNGLTEEEARKKIEAMGIAIR